MDQLKVPADYLALPINEGHYLAIGHVAAMWNVVENSMRWILWRLLRLTSETGGIITAKMRHPEIGSILNNLCHTLNVTEDNQKEVAEIVSEANRLRDLRNEIVHAVWNFGDTENEFEIYNPKLKNKIWSAEKIHSVAFDMSSLIRRILEASASIYMTFDKSDNDKKGVTNLDEFIIQAAHSHRKLD